MLDREAVQTLRDNGFWPLTASRAATESVEDIKNWLLETASTQLLNEHCGPQPDFEKATSSDEFKAWATDERRLGS